MVDLSTSHHGIFIGPAFSMFHICVVRYAQEVISTVTVMLTYAECFHRYLKRCWFYSFCMFVIVVVVGGGGSAGGGFCVIVGGCRCEDFDNDADEVNIDSA
ncbi:Hypothetical predicted protein [Octopus vulgaris]|uniref:Transmembrane protein n=1 Tax=Octopus vulgaris TaxID=6645 RepID=A0AA36B517_OCTVU|nr:Hypothetical predicted protein [Octopus vulgaris]